MTPIVMDGKREFRSMADAARWLLESDGIEPTAHAIGCMTPAICRCVHRKQASAYGHTWKAVRR